MKVGWLGKLNALMSRTFLCRFLNVNIALVFSFFVVNGNIYANNSVDFEQWKQQSAQEYKQYISERDRAFSGFLKLKWIEADVEVKQKTESKPKPQQAPVNNKNAESEQKKSNKPLTTSDSTIQRITPTTKDFPAIKEPDTIMPTTGDAITLGSHGVSFLGHTLKMPKANIKPLNLEVPSSESISNAWLTMSKLESEVNISAINEQSKWLNLDDWGRAFFTYQYLKQSASVYLSDTSNDLVLHTWFYLVKQGLNVRIAYDKTNVYLLLNTERTLYSQKYFTLAGQKYYFVNFSDLPSPLLKSVFTYQKQHEAGSKPLQIDLSRLPNLNKSDTQRKISFTYAQEPYDISVHYHQEYVSLLNKYPQLDVKYYFSTKLHEQTKQSLLQPLAKIIDGRTEEEALNILLRFVQKGFAYQTDDQQFNAENFMFATEVLHYPYADCEDRSVLYSYLVKHLLGNKIIGVLYKGHIATAVQLNKPMKGQSYLVNGEKFYVADPTYIGANIGEIMPGYESQSPKLIKVN